MNIKEKVGRIILRMRGEYDALRGLPAKKLRQPDYLAGYAKQYETEQRMSHAQPF